MKRSLLVFALVAAAGLIVANLFRQTDDWKADAPADGETGRQTIVLRFLTETWPGLDAVIEAYEGQHPGIKIVRQSYPYDQLFDVIDVKMGTGTSDIDAFVVDEPMVAGYSQQGYLLALDDYFDASDREGMLPGSLSTGYYRDRLMAVPMNTSEQLLFYNKKLLTEAGIEWPSERIEDRLAWEDVVEMSQLLMSRLNDGTGGREPVWGLMFEQIGRPYQMLALPNSLGGRGIGDDGVTTDGIVNDEAWVRSMQFYSDLFNRYRISPKGVKAYESRNLFLSGQIAFFVGGTWDIQGFLTAEQKLDFGYAPHPYFRDGTPVTPTGSWHLGINVHAKHPRETADFIRYLAIGQGADIWLGANGDIPSKMSLLDRILKDGQYDAFPNSGLRIGAYEALHTGMTRPVTPYYREWDKRMTAAMEDIRNGADPKEMLDKAASDLTRLMKPESSP